MKKVTEYYLQVLQELKKYFGSFGSYKKGVDI